MLTGRTHAKFVGLMFVAAVLACGGLRAQTAAITGTVTTTDPTHTPRIFRDGVANVATAPKAFPGTLGTGNFNYDIVTRTNSTAAQMQVQVVLTLTGTATGQVHVTAYTNPFAPTNIATNYLGDCGSSTVGSPDYVGLSFFVAAGGTYDLVLTEITQGGSSDYQLLIYESSTNTAPVLDNTGASAMTAIAQDVPSGSNQGNTVAQIIASGAGGNPITDADTGAVEGIAIIQTDNTNGTWEFSTNGGTSWNPVGNLTFGFFSGEALVLSDAATNRVRFTPNAAFTGTIASGFQYLAWDQTNGTSGQVLPYYTDGAGGGNMGNVGSLSDPNVLEDVAITVNVQAAVTVTNVSPPTGPLAGGTNITITGTEFGASSTVTVGGTAATNVVVVSATTITCDTPAGAVGPASVIVTSNGQSNAANTLFTYSNNAAPTINLTTGSSFAGSAGAGFTLALNPGAALANAQLDLFDADGDPIDLNSVTITTAPTGVAAPAPATAQASGTTISFSGTADASNPSGDYVYTLDIDDNVNPAVQITVTITINNLPPTHAAAGGATGAGTIPSPYTGTTVVGSAAGVNLATVADPNTSQTVTLSGAPTNTAAPGTATITFSFAITAGTLTATPSAAPAAADVGDFDYTVIVTDNGSTPQTTTFYVRVTVIAGTAPTITSTAVTTATEGTLYTYTFTTTGTPTPTISLTTGTLPGWLTLVGNTLSGTPPVGAAGTVGPLTFTASNGVPPAATQTFSIIVSTAGGGGGGGGGDDKKCSTGESDSSLLMLAGVLATFALALRLRRKTA